MCQSQSELMELKEVVSYDPITGEFKWLSDGRGRVSGAAAGGKRPDGYVRITYLGRQYYAHILAVALTHGAWPQGDVDHVNGNPSDNRIKNLRSVTHRENVANRRYYASLGTTRNGKGFGAQITVKGKRLWLGTFKTESEAQHAYMKARAEHGIYVPDPEAA